MTLRPILLCTAAALVAACASGSNARPDTRPAAPRPDAVRPPAPAPATPAEIAALNADLRLVNNETTWVARERGVEFVGLTKGDVVAAKAVTNLPLTILHQIFPTDTSTRVVLAIRREPGRGQRYLPGAPVSATTANPAVELVVPNPTAPPGAWTEGFPYAPLSPALPLERAWLSAHATTVTKQPAQREWEKGDLVDPRIHAWAEELIPSLVNDSVSRRAIPELATHPDSLIPLATFFAMAKPSAVAPRLAETAPMGGRGGMGGRRGGMGRSPGGAPDNGSRERASLKPVEWFVGQSAVLGEYLATHYNYATIGKIVDAQLAGKTVDEALKSAGIDGGRLELDWKDWLSRKAAPPKKQPTGRQIHDNAVD